ncbi:hypothetical protein A4L_12 [Anabaena phage A-4L]|uniref:Uncharacterized protein n=1 Tax=Anabaena phage A-4L TaxID=1357732 RepID=A0A059PY21_9CAUD|nr:hypothetical protein A4L_12 [Anabaena phage A-4L]AGR48539.1 hypothetical protein A4L_12 [Anabaena phage A-4L]
MSRREISNEYWVLLVNWMSKLTRKYFKNKQEAKHNDRLVELVTLFIEYSRLPEFDMKSGAWLMSRWSFILPDVLFWLWLESKGISIDQPLSELFKPSGLVAKLRQIETIKAEMTRLGLVINQRTILNHWLQKQTSTPTPETMFNWYWTLEKYSSVWCSKRQYEHLFTREEIINA